MKRTFVFAKRCIIENLRDPVNYIFAFGLPIVMLFIMTAINKSIPEEASMNLFRIEYLTPGIAVFSFTFTMLFASLTVSRDKETALAARLCASPMRSMDFTLGYFIPYLFTAAVQCVVAFAAGGAIGLSEGYYFDFAKVMICLACSIPCAVVFVSLGIIFGLLFSERSAPSASSIIITAAGLLGGIWMDVESIGGAIFNVSKFLPFYHSVSVMRNAILSPCDIVEPLLITTAFAAALFTASALLTKKLLYK